MKHCLIFLILVMCCASNISYANGSATVINGNNDGPGSLREALEAGNSIVRIDRNVSTIFISQPLSYDRRSGLRLIGSGQTIDGSALAADQNILTVTRGANLSVAQISFIGNSLEANPNPAQPTGGKGIFVKVPENRAGVVSVRLREVSVMRVGNHGVHVSDCTLGDECGGGSGGFGDGSPASIHVTLEDVTINGVGFGRADADGVRVDDRGDGNIYFSARNSKFINVGADGIELDEGDKGNVIVDVQDSLFDGNGEYCALAPFIAASPCDDDGDPDVDDGFDIDEAGEGSIFARIRDTTIINNFDEGLDFDEQGRQGIQVIMNNVYAADNQDEGIKLSEQDGGSVTAFMQRVTVVDNNGSKEGVEIEESDRGDVSVTFLDSNFIGGQDEKLKVEQAGEGKGILKVRRSRIEALDLDNVDPQLN